MEDEMRFLCRNTGDKRRSSIWRIVLPQTRSPYPNIFRLNSTNSMQQEPQNTKTYGAATVWPVGTNSWCTIPSVSWKQMSIAFPFSLFETMFLWPARFVASIWQLLALFPNWIGNSNVLEFLLLASLTISWKCGTLNRFWTSVRLCNTNCTLIFK